MIHKIEQKYFSSRGPIQILYPGLAIGHDDTGIGSIGRIDHAEVRGNATIPMHPHINDEILSYFRSGKGLHRDSEGYEEIIGKERMMYMKAGKLFYHEETMMNEDEPLEGLQIFIRPGEKDLKPTVTFWDLDKLHSINEWRLIASGTSETIFQFSSETWIYDTKLLSQTNIGLPIMPKQGLTSLLYVFKGSIKVNNEVALNKKEGIVFKNEPIQINSTDDAELVLFVTNEKANIYKEGMYSGNKVRKLFKLFVFY